MQAFADTSARPATAPAALMPPQHGPVAKGPFDDLTLRVLSTPEERVAIAALRKLSASAVEDDLGFGLSPFETVRDQIGMVAAIERDGVPIATIRLVPSGHGMTGLERLAPGALEPGIVVPHSWEVGRLIVAPEERHPDLLGQCFVMALTELVRTRRVEHFYAIATPLMARLWRRFGMRVATTLRGASGKEFAVVHGSAQTVAAALKFAPQLLARTTRTEETADAAVHSEHAALLH
jgi:hypothetical protein